MPHEIRTISLPLPLNLSKVNCFLIKTDAGFILIDTGYSAQRIRLTKELENAGCKPGDLRLIILTHGDFDHSGNAAWIRDFFGTNIAMHVDDAGMVEQGDMFLNRKKNNRFLRQLIPILFGFPRSARFKPDIYLADGTDLSSFGFDAQVISLPGHSLGSIGILTVEGDLFCGDLFSNLKKPTLNDIMDDQDAAQASLEKLKSYNITTVYPGHGVSFPMEAISSAYGY